jgi:hypothetical protein
MNPQGKLLCAVTFADLLPLALWCQDCGLSSVCGAITRSSVSSSQTLLWAYSVPSWSLFFRLRFYCHHLAKSYESAARRHFQNVYAFATLLNKIRVICCYNLSLCLTDYAPHHKDVWGKWTHSFTILDHGIRCRWVLSFNPRQLYPRGNTSQYQLDSKMTGPRSRSGRYGE